MKDDTWLAAGGISLLLAVVVYGFGFAARFL